MAKKPQIRIGISGWTYAPWRGNFYPKGLPQKQELEYASRTLSSIEINGTFYSLQKPESFQSWADQVPEDFCFALKAPQFITHVRRLKDCEEPLANFLASGVFRLGPKLGPILWQFPPNVMLKDDRFEKFFRLLPRDAREAAKIARRHGDKVKGRACVDLEVEGNFPIRHAFEFRHKSFRNAEFIELMREYGIAVVVADSSSSTPLIEDVTADFVYVRMHGEDKKYAKGYTPSALERWARRIQTWAKGGQPSDAECVSPENPSKLPRDVFVYFSTEQKEHSPGDAMNLLKLLNPASRKPVRKAA